MDSYAQADSCQHRCRIHRSRRRGACLKFSRPMSHARRTFVKREFVSRVAGEITCDDRGIDARGEHWPSKKSTRERPVSVGSAAYPFYSSKVRVERTRHTLRAVLTLTLFRFD